MKFNVQREIWSDLIVLRGVVEQPNGNTAALMPVSIVQREPGSIVQPFLEMQLEEGQALMDELWNAGLRPSEGTGSAGSLAATKAHLEDMRSLVFERTPK